MSTEWEKLEGNEGVLTVEVAVEKVKEALDATFQKVVKDVNVPGFRKGKMPRHMFEQRFGVESLYDDALDMLLPEAYMGAIVESGIEPVDRPDIEIVQMEKGKPLIFKATVTVKPEVILGEYKGLEVDEFDVTITDEEVDLELISLQEKFADLVIKEEGTAEEGDTVVIDFEGSLDGVPFDGGAAENHSLILGSNSFIPGFEEQLIGVASGEEKDIEITFPEEYHAEDLAGQDAVFKVTVHEIKTKELPALDDEFAKDVDEEVETLVELKEKTKARLEEELKLESENFKRNALIEQVTANAEITLPPSMIKTELERMMQEFEQNLQTQGMDLEMFYQLSGQDEEQLQEQMRYDAKQRVLVSLTLEAIGEKEAIEVSDEEVNEELDKMAAMYGMPVEQIKQALGSLEGIRADLVNRSVMNLLVEHSVTVVPNPEVVEETAAEEEATEETK